jgi:hypothetical protein
MHSRMAVDLENDQPLLVGRFSMTTSVESSLKKQCLHRMEKIITMKKSLLLWKQSERSEEAFGRHSYILFGIPSNTCLPITLLSFKWCDHHLVAAISTAEATCRR